jgi:RimJ/RimL family protein N-acetyltransferase
VGLELPDELVVDELRLRPPTPADVPAITALCQDEAIREYTIVPSPYTADDARAWVEMCTRAVAEGDGASLLVVRDGVPAAAVGMSVNARDRVGIVGYWVGAEHRGHGIATRATRALCRWAFDHWGLEHISLDAATGNEGSNAVARRLGFTLVGVQRRAMRLGVSGEQVDRNLWGLLPDELR